MNNDWVKIRGDRSFAKKVLRWYAEHQRTLPWRGVRDPYRIWLSEIILQQTRIVQGRPYYERFLAAYPTVSDLAMASEQEVLHHWQGLGYYTRARNLHKCAQYVTEKLGGKFPTTAEELKKLPGIGPYTAAAIASMAYQEPVAAVDGNVYRILSRVFGIEEEITSTQGQKVFRHLAQSLIDREKPGDFNQALMDFGSSNCTPKKPLCNGCIFSDVCLAKATGQQERFPIKAAKRPIKERFFHYLVLQGAEHIYVKKRSGKDIWQGLYDFYLVEGKQAHAFDKLEDPLVDRIKALQLPVRQWGKSYRHQLTHQRIHASFFYIEVRPELQKKLVQMELYPCPTEEIYTFPFPVLLNTFLKEKEDGSALFLFS